MTLDSISVPRFLFVVTYGRSGSTLVQGLLNAMPGVLVRGENNLFVLPLFRSWDALASFQDAAATYASPDLHFNMGLCHERLGEYAAALRSFEAYLRNKPDAPDRASVEHRIELLGELASREDEAVAASRPASVPSVELPTIEVPFPREGSPAAGTRTPRCGASRSRCPTCTPRIRCATCRCATA